MALLQVTQQAQAEECKAALERGHVDTTFQVGDQGVVGRC